MIKTVKGKVIAGTLAFGLVAGGGVAFGATDAGANLKAWYDGQFGKSSDSVETQVAKYAGDKVPGLVGEYNKLKSDASGKISLEEDMSTQIATSNINRKSQAYITQVNNEKAAIDTYLAGQFDSLSAFADGLINEAGREALKYANNDLTKYTGDLGDAAIGNVNTDLTNATTQAVSNLGAAIEGAKDNLQASLDEETGLTVIEIKGPIDAKIEELRGLITAKKNELVATQRGLITAKAQELQGDAEDAMDALVSGINK